MFDLTIPELRRLTDAQLRALVARLCEAEVVARAGLRRAVRWGGSQTAADGGLDVEVGPEGGVAGDFVPRTWTGFQVKKSPMPAGAIRKEVSPKGTLRPIVRQIAEAGGAYVVITLDDGVDGLTAQAREARCRVMAEEVERACGTTGVHLDVYGVDELLQWLRSQPGVALWVREVLGLPLRGWKSHGRWTAVPADADDGLIREEGLRVTVPGQRREETDLVAAIEAIRGLIRQGRQAIRIAGLSGLGKTRMVQALFEEDVGADALDPATAIYADLGESPDPPPRDVLARLVVERQPAVLVLDNCAPDVHARLAQEAAQAGTRVRLVTVEYDVADDRPELTEVVRVDAAGPDICEALVRRRFPTIGQANARLVAEFADGNARIALALAGVVERGETLTRFSNEDLFRRLFHQRRDDRDDGLLRSAEALSLVYSFSVSPGEDGPAELDVLGRLIGKDRQGIHGDAQELLGRQLAQRRGDWRAILPTALANRLARSALGRLPVDVLRRTFEQEGNQRLLISFARRLGYLHDAPSAVAIAEAWLAPEGLLRDLTLLNDTGIKMLAHVAPAAPESALAAIEATLHPIDDAVARWRVAASLQTVVALLTSLAHDPTVFDRCVRALATLARTQEEGTRRDPIRDKLLGLFPVILSGTEAGPEQRARVVRGFLDSPDPEEVALGRGMLAAALRTDHFILNRDIGFGARPRSFGWLPASREDEAAWFALFLDVALDRLASRDDATQAQVRSLLADRLRGLWWYAPLRHRLAEAARALHSASPWIEGWRAIRATLWFDHRGEAREKDPDGARELEALAAELQPQDLTTEVRAYVLEAGHRTFTLVDELDPEDPERWRKGLEALSARAEELGRAVAADPATLEALLPGLLTASQGRLRDFGRGLARGTDDVAGLWARMLETVEAVGEGAANVAVAGGVLQATAERDPELARALVDEALGRPATRRFAVWWLTAFPIDGRGVGRLREVLSDPGDLPAGFGMVFWGREFDAVAPKELTELLRLALAKPGAHRLLVDAVDMRCQRERELGRPLDEEFTRLGLEIACRVMEEPEQDRDRDGGMTDHHLGQLLRACLDPTSHPEEGARLLRAFAERVREAHGFVDDLDDVSQALLERMPEAFLDAVLLDPAISRHAWRHASGGSWRGRHLLASLPTDAMLGWLGRDLEGRVAALARAVRVYQDQPDGEGSRLSEHAIAILAAAPRPEVVAAFASAAVPMSWSGSRADIIARRRAALAKMLAHPVPSVAAAVARHLPELETREASARRSELQEARQEDERFE